MEPNGSISTSQKDGGRIPVLEMICSGDSLPLVVERFNIKSFSALTILDWLLGLFSGSLFNAHTGRHPLIKRLQSLNFFLMHL
jgi:hypothetical protein